MKFVSDWARSLQASFSWCRRLVRTVSHVLTSILSFATDNISIRRSAFKINYLYYTGLPSSRAENILPLSMATLTRPQSLPQSATNSLLNSLIPSPFPIDQLYQDSCEDHRPTCSGSNDISPPKNVQVTSSTDSTIEKPSTTTHVSSSSTSHFAVLFFTLLL